MFAKVKLLKRNLCVKRFRTRGLRTSSSPWVPTRRASQGGAGLKKRLYLQSIMDLSILIIML